MGYVAETQKFAQAQKRRTIDAEITLAQREAKAKEVEERLSSAESAIEQNQKDVIFHDKELIFMEGKLQAELGKISK